MQGRQTGVLAGIVEERAYVCCSGRGREGLGLWEAATKVGGHCRGRRQARSTWSWNIGRRRTEGLVTVNMVLFLEKERERKRE